MDNRYAYDLECYMVARKEEPLPLFPPRTALPRRFSATTEIFEDENAYYDSPMRSVASFGTGSTSTLSTPDIVTTPKSTGLTSFDFHIDDESLQDAAANTRGPSGPHLFRSPMISSGFQSDFDVDLRVQDTPVTSTGPFHHRASKFDPWRRDTPVPNTENATTPQPQYIPNVERAPAFHRLSTTDWSPQEVVQWMQSLGYEDDIVQKFLQNDISGSILLGLQANDLKELDIMSFGKRHRVLNSIQVLKSGSSISSASTATSTSSNSSVTADVSSTAPTSAVMSNNSHHSSTSISSNSCHSCSMTDDDATSFERPQRRRQHSSPDVRKVSDIQPGDSVSIVAIEQLLPKAHHCSKGENCRKWQRQQIKISRLAQGLPIEAYGCGRAIVAGDPGNPQTAPNLLKPSTKSEVPSIVASSDALGPKQASFPLCQEKLNEVQPRDPQENVRNFLNFQSLSRLQTANNPATPPKEHLVSPDCDSPDSAKITPTLAENLGRLPRLKIPSCYGSETSAGTEYMSALKTVTPSILTRPNQLYANDLTAIPGRLHPNFGMRMASPADYYRTDPCYRQETPLSETDAPVTAIPISSIAREESQSVPPNMRFGNELFVTPDPIPRPSSTRPLDEYRRYPSNQGGPTLNTLREGRVLSPIETPEDLHRTVRAPHCRSEKIFNPDQSGDLGVSHSGWMKKRKTTRLLRHEWEDHHFTLKGTQLAMHNDEDAHRRHSRALEYVDVDDYAVACSSLPSSSKITAAFKKTILKRRTTGAEDSAFTFSLIPAPNNTGGAVDRRTLFLNSGKSHHFAVKTRDQRIDWMRELMLAKVLKRGRESGTAVNINNNMI